MRAHLNRLNRFAGASLLIAGFGVALTASSCSNPVTEVVAGFTTQIQVPKELRSVAIVITQGGRLISCTGYRAVDGTVKLPGTVGILPAASRDGVPPEAVKISVLGFRNDLDQEFDSTCFVQELPNTAAEGEDANDVLVVRRAALQYAGDRIVFAPMPLKESCADVNCDSEKTCIGGVCEDAAVDSASLATYRDELIFGDANTCFNPNICMSGSLLAVQTDAESCTYRFPAEALELDFPRNPGELNVEVVYNTLGTEILDLDDREGFIFPDENDPWTFQLAPNLCTSQFKKPLAAGLPPKILSVHASPLCVAKRALQPICTDAMDEIQAGERSPLSVIADNDLCPLGPPLQSTESLLYVLMDRSESMGEFFGPNGLEFAVGLPLQNPVAAQTRMAMSFLPAELSDCDAGAAFGTPDHGFGIPKELFGAISADISDPSTLLASDPTLYLDAALRGAYSALHLIDADLSATFNRKAVVIIGNRDFQTECAANLELEALAAAELGNADPIHTYVAVLKPPDGSPDDPATQSAGAAIATAGGTVAFDAVDDETEGALAVQKVFNDLGSCLYDPLMLPFNANPDSDITALTFVNPITQEATVVPREVGCTSPDDNVDGFGYDADQQVVICGEPCTTLRTALIDTATYYAILQQPAPALPVLPSLACTEKAALIEAFDFAAP